MTNGKVIREPGLSEIRYRFSPQLYVSLNESTETVSVERQTECLKLETTHHPLDFSGKTSLLDSNAELVLVQDGFVRLTFLLGA